MRDLFGHEVTLDEARILAKRSPPRDRATLVRMRTLRGLHPHNGMPLRQPEGETCGSCAHHRVKRYSKSYHKCGLTQDSRGPATDIRVRWPACEKWEAKK